MQCSRCAELTRDYAALSLEWGQLAKEWESGYRDGLLRRMHGTAVEQAALLVKMRIHLVLAHSHERGAAFAGAPAAQ